MIVRTKIVPIKKNQLVELQEHLERFCNVSLVFGFDKARYDFNLFKSFLLLFFVYGRDFEPAVIKKANHFITFTFGDIQVLDILNFLGGARSLDSFLKAYKFSET